MTHQTTSLPLNGQREAILDGVALLSRVFRGPDPESCKDMIRGNCLLAFQALSSTMTLDPPGVREELEAFFSGFGDAGSLFEVLEESYVRLFISNRGGIPAPLYQSCYEDTGPPGKAGLLMGKAAVDMQQRLESAGLSLDESLGQMPDHLSLEIEYLYFLIERGDHGKGTGRMEQAIAFCRDTMLPWVLEFRQRLDEAEENIIFYPLMASLLISVLRLLAGMPRGSI